MSGQEFGMQDLRLIGVHEDGEHLLLSGPDGEHYRLVVDDALRAATRRDRPRLGQLQIEMEGGMRPREVQSLIRAGASAEEVAERAGWTVEKVRRYEVPIMAERVHMAEQARLVRVRSRGGSSSAGASGSVAPTLQGRVAQRMRERGVDPDRNVWDSWRAVEERHWTVVLTFAAGGRQRQAMWTYDPVLKTVEPVEDEARWLSADEPAAVGPLPAVPARASSVYDVEAEGGVGASPRRPGARSTQEEEPLDLMTAMRQRTTVGRRAGRRRSGAAEPVRRDTAPALPLESERHLESPAEPSPAESPAAQAEPESKVEPPGAESPPLEDARVDPGPAQESIEETAKAPTKDRGARADEDPAAESADDEPDASEWEAVSAAPSSEPTPLSKKAATRRKPRPSVPSWDDIMFGTKRD